jgi:predicted RNA-binding Zn ribbon-like protein
MMVTERRREAGEGVPEIGQAPGDLELVQRFVNTRDIEQATDELSSPAALAEWLAAAGLTGGRVPKAGRAELELALEQREALRGVLRAHAGHAPARDTASDLTAIAANFEIRLGVDADGRIRPRATADGVRSGLVRLLLIAAEAGTAGTWPRLKACSADDCQWAFYDRSPTRNACWCSMQVCGSRSKSRAYRQRSAAGASTRARASRSARTAAPGA